MAYKDSGIEWISKIPKHWDTKKLKWVVSKIGSGVTPKGGAQVYQDEGVPLLRSQNVHFDGLRLDDVAYISNKVHESMKNSHVKSGDVLLNITGASIGRCSVSPSNLGEANVNQHVCILRPINSTISGYLHLVMVSDTGQVQVFNSQNGTSREGLNFEQLGKFVVPYPSTDEQQSIADYLDKKTVLIDELIEKKKRQVELLKEQRQAVINQAVTKGLDPNVEMKDSGIPWMPKIAIDWQSVKLGYFVDLLPGFAFQSKEFSYLQSDIKLLRGINVAPGSIRWEETVYWAKDDYTLLEQFQLKQGDIVIGMDRPWVANGMRIAEVKSCDIPSLLLQRVARLRAKSPLTQQFLSILLSSKFFIEYFTPILTGVSVPHISGDQIMSFRFGLPLEKDLGAIVDFLTENFIETERVVSKAEKQIQLLQEYRISLISEVVTGKIDVRKVG